MITDKEIHGETAKNVLNRFAEQLHRYANDMSHPSPSPDVDKMREALKAAIELIKIWHNMGILKDEAEDTWKIYYNKSPEMKLIRETLSNLTNK